MAGNTDWDLGSKRVPWDHRSLAPKWVSQEMCTKMTHMNTNRKTELGAVMTLTHSRPEMVSGTVVLTTNEIEPETSMTRSRTEMTFGTGSGAAASSPTHSRARNISEVAMLLPICSRTGSESQMLHCQQPGAGYGSGAAASLSRSGTVIERLDRPTAELDTSYVYNCVYDK